MKNTSKKPLTLIATLLLASSGLLVSGCSNPLLENEVKEEESAESEIAKIDNKNINIKSLYTGKDSNGKSYKTFSWTVTPSDATNKSVTATLSMSGYTASQIEEQFVTVTINNDNQTVRVTCLNPFSSTITLTLTSNADSSITGSITIDYVEKFKGFVTESNRTDYPIVLKCSSENTGSHLPWEFSNVSSSYQSVVDTIFNGDVFIKDGNVLSNNGGEYYGGDSSGDYTTLSTSNNKIIPSSTWSQGFSSTYSKALSKTGFYNMSFSPNSTYYWDFLPYQNYTSDSDIEAVRTVMADFNDTIGTYAGAGLNSVTDGTWSQMAFTAISSEISDYCSLVPQDAQVLENAKSKIALIGLRGTFDLTLSDVNEEFDATYSIDLCLMTEASNLSFYNPVTSLSPEVTGIEF